MQPVLLVLLVPQVLLEQPELPELLAQPVTLDLLDPQVRPVQPELLVQQVLRQL